MNLPSALVIGPMKCGTSWIHEYLSWRGDVCLPAQVKETFFFDDRRNRGVDWYARHFRHHDPLLHRCIVEVAPTLFHMSGAPERVLDVLGEVPLIVTVRDPLERAWSHYQHLRRKGYTRAPLREAAEEFPEIIEASRYDHQIARWARVFPKVTITVLDLQDLAGEQAAYVRALCGGLNIGYRPAPEHLLQPVGAGGVPASFTLARIGRKAATGLRSVGAYGVVNLAKKAGLKRLFFGRPARSARPGPSGAERHFLEEKILIG